MTRQTLTQIAVWTSGCLLILAAHALASSLDDHDARQHCRHTHQRADACAFGAPQ